MYGYILKHRKVYTFSVSSLISVKTVISVILGRCLLMKLNGILLVVVVVTVMTVVTVIMGLSLLYI